MVESQLPLEICERYGNLTTCRFTSFIARNARRIARYWSAQRNGKEPNALIAVRRNFPRNCRSLPLRPGALPRVRLAQGNRVHAVCAALAGHIRISELISKFTQQVIDAFLKTLASRDLDPID